MKINDKELRGLIKNLISELNLKESDIIATQNSEWKKMKNEFKNVVTDLIKNIEDDKYSDANGNIDKAMKTLKVWKKRLAKNLTDSTGL